MRAFCQCGGGCGRVRGCRVPPCPRKAPALWNTTHARPGDCRRWQARDHLTIQRHGGGTCRRVSDQGLERRGLPGPIAVRHPEDLALPHVEADIVRGVPFPRGTLTVSSAQATLPRWLAPRHRGDGGGGQTDTDFTPSVPSPRGLNIAVDQHLAFVHHQDPGGRGEDQFHLMCDQQHRQVEHDRLDEVATRSPSATDNPASGPSASTMRDVVASHHSSNCCVPLESGLPRRAHPAEADPFEDLAGLCAHPLDHAVRTPAVHLTRIAGLHGTTDILEYGQVGNRRVIRKDGPVPICAIWSAVRPVAPDPSSTPWPLAGGTCQPAGWGDCLPCSARPAHAGCDRELMSLTALSAQNRLLSCCRFRGQQVKLA